MKTKTFKWAILGPGKIAHKFAKGLAEVPGAELYAVASRSLVKAEEFAKEFNVPKFYGSYEDLVNDKEVDIVYVATPHVFHYEHTLLCLKHKKAVLCEKPFAMNKEQVNEMILTAKKENIFLMEALWTYFLPHYQYVLELVKSEKFGKITSLEADFGFEAPYLPEKRLFKKDLGGGSLLDIGIYPVFAALSLLGKPDTISAKAEFSETGVDESCKVDFNYQNGVCASLYSTIKKMTPTIATITFEDATLTINRRFHEPTSVTILHNNQEETILFDVNTNGYNFEAEHVQQMLANGRTESTVMSFEKSLELIGLLDDIREEIGLIY
ncbi:MAG TPA: Gfo/Idh/MocA family oxidoreductase [Gillisia sp.]|nr:Gfo/Idh/MocA family oxidoreductase [Gillisia sp.]